MHKIRQNLIGIFIISIFIVLFILILLLPILFSNNNSPIPANPQAIPTIQYVKGSIDKLQNIHDHPATQTSHALTIRQKLIGQANPETESIYSSKTFTVLYDKSLDMFIGIIYGNDISAAESDTFSWTQSQGLSLEETCKLPLYFELSAQSSIIAAQKNVIFDPIPKGCNE